MNPGDAPTDENLPIFIYGTLRPGQKNYRRFLSGRTRREMPARTEGELYLFLSPDGARYPFLIPGEESVRGALVYLREDCREETLEEIDRLEGYDRHSDTGLYLRRRRRVDADTGERVTAWVYLWNGPWTETVKIVGGDFAAWRQDEGPAN